MKNLLLVDGSSYLYRAFHALPDLRNARNEPTGAIYGVLNMLQKLRKEMPADYIACVFDAKGKTFRDDLYPEYKATRSAMPPELAAQIAPLHEAVRAMGWPLLMVDGVEADDVIGTLAYEANKHGMRTIISTGDKDMAQLVNANVELVNTMSNERLDIAGVQSKFGIPAERIVDYLTLIGDAVDNVPGVEKVGPKTAVKWLSQYGTLDAIVAHASEIGGVVGENLRAALDWLPQARALLTIKCDVPLPLHVNDLCPSPPEFEKLRELFTRFEFKTWLRDLQSPAESSPPPDPEPACAAQYETILTLAQLDAWADKIAQADIVALDTETTSLDPMQARLVGISLSIAPHTGAYIPLAHQYAGAPQQLNLDATLARLKPWLENILPRKLGQHLKYDAQVLANHGVKLRGIVHDTLLQSYVLEAHKPHGMDSLAERHLNYKTVAYEEVCGKGAKQICFDQVEIGAATQYAAEDADITLRLHQALYPQIAQQPKLKYVYEEIELPTAEVLCDIERTGVLLDCDLLNQQSHELGLALVDLEAQAHAIAGHPFNLNSPKQIQEILFTRLGLPVKKKTPSGTPSTDEDVLQELALDYPLPKLLLEYRGLAKLKSTYTDKLPRMVHPLTGRVHTCYNQAVAVTGRLASADPNLQNIPVRTAEGRRIREAFIAPPDAMLISVDYSQIELRIMAHLSHDEGFLKAFAAGEDIHRATAAEVFAVSVDEVSSEQRRYAKVINFGLIYGMSAFGLASNLGIERSAAQAYIDRYFARYPGVAAYMNDTRELARAQGYVETVFGRRLWLPEINGGNGMRRQAAERAAINAPMQGTAADLIKLAMIAVHKFLQEGGYATRIIMQVHDELVLEVPNAELATIQKELPRLMAGVAQLDVPLEVDMGTGPNWEKAH